MDNTLPSVTARLECILAQDRQLLVVVEEMTETCLMTLTSLQECRKLLHERTDITSRAIREVTDAVQNGLDAEAMLQTYLSFEDT